MSRPRATSKKLQLTNLSVAHADNSSSKEKSIILVRHGCTYMNEYLRKAGQAWGDHTFTDIFHESEIHLYRDTPLSPKGVQQAKKLSSVLRDKNTGEHISLASEVQLVVTSPLTRALQTTELGILPHLNPQSKTTPFLALPLASERLYLVSDLGSPISKIASKFPFVDFESEFRSLSYDKDEWWYTHKDNTYEEWRPSGQGQQYYCYGEPDDHFNQRMEKLYDWLHARSESTIALVCHYGVIEYLTGGQEFNNCEIAIYKMSQLTRSGSKLNSMASKI